MHRCTKINQQKQKCRLCKIIAALVALEVIRELGMIKGYRLPDEIPNSTIFLNNKNNQKLVSNQLIVDFDKWCEKEHRENGTPRQLTCQKAVDHFKGEFTADYIRKHTSNDYKQKFRQNNAKKRDYNKSKIQRLKDKFPKINVDDVGVLLHESVQK